MDDKELEEFINSTITEQMTRVRRDVLGSIGRVMASDCGCDFEYACCMEKGCCSEKGCCNDKTIEIEDMIESRYDILRAYIRSNREPIVKYFRERGVSLKL